MKERLATLGYELVAKPGEFAERINSEIVGEK